MTAALRASLRHISVVHIHGLWNRVVWAAAREARRAGVPYVLSPRGMLDAGSFAHHSWRKRAAYALLERRTIQHAARIHVTSDHEAASVHDWHAAAKIVCIPNGVDGVLQARSERASARPPSVLFVGRLHPTKRLDLLIDAFAQLRRTHSSVHLVIAGPDEFNLQPALSARAGGHADAITWAGPVAAAQRDRLLTEADALVLCSDSESFGLSVLEAMANAVPVVVTDTCGWSDVEKHGAGMIVPQRADAIAHAIERVIANPSQAAAMGRRGQALVAARYGWDSLAPKFIQTYTDVAATRQALAAATS